MKLYIDPSGGIAGDMFVAGLLSLGAPVKEVLNAMKLAGSKLGEVSVQTEVVRNSSTRLKISLKSNYKHLKGSKAREILGELFDHLSVQEKYRKLGFQMLDNLIRAERKAHSENHFVSDHYHISPVGVYSLIDEHEFIDIFSNYKDGLRGIAERKELYIVGYDNFQSHYNLLENETGIFALSSSYRPNPIHIAKVKLSGIQGNRLKIEGARFRNNTPILDIRTNLEIKSIDKLNAGEKKINIEAFLHEAQDILIDIVGAVVGMSLLDIETNAYLLAPVSLGGGVVHFSHGELSVPSPATKIMIEEFNIPSRMGPVNTELCTPTGVAILAALQVKLDNSNLKNQRKGEARGTKEIDVEPLKLYLVD
ncbi:nickel insertion protein [Bacteroidota bacterium]